VERVGRRRPREQSTPLKSVARQLGPSIRTIDQVANRISPTSDIEGIDELSCVGNDIGQGPDTTCDNGTPSRHCFEHRNAETFIRRREGHDGCGAVQEIEVRFWNSASPNHLGGQTIGIDGCSEDILTWSGTTREDQSQVWSGLRKSRKGRNERDVVLMGIGNRWIENEGAISESESRKKFIAAHMVERSPRIAHTARDDPKK